MSRIVRGQSAEIKEIKIAANVQREATPYRTNIFRSAHIADSITQEELEERVNAAREESKTKIIQETEKRLNAPIQKGLESIESILSELSSFRRELFKEAEQEIISMIREISKRVVMKELSVAPEQLQQIVSKALEIVEKQRRVSMSVSTADMNFFLKAKPELMDKFKNIEELDLAANPQIPQGQVILKSESVQVDVKLDSMVDHLLTQLLANRTEAKEVNEEEGKPT